MTDYEPICAAILELLNREFELPVAEVGKRLPFNRIDSALAFSMLVMREQAVLVYRIVGNDTPFFDLDALIDYIEKNNLPKNVDTVAYARIVRTPENTAQRCLDCGGPFPPKDGCDYPPCAAKE